MAKIAVWNWKKEQVGEVAVPAGVFDYPYRKHLVWEVVKAYEAGLRAGTHKTKVRSEVSGSGKKPFKQKGTGRARQGGSRPPIHRHGGTAHGPVPRSYATDISVGEKKNALKAVLSSRFGGCSSSSSSGWTWSPQDRDLKAAVGHARARGQGALRRYPRQPQLPSRLAQPSRAEHRRFARGPCLRRARPRDGRVSPGAFSRVVQLSEASDVRRNGSADR